MSSPHISNHTANFEVAAAFLNFELIFSSDFTGTLNGVAYAGAADEFQSFSGEGTVLGSMQVVVTTGSVRLVGVTS